MSTLIRTAFVAAALFASTSATMAAPYFVPDRSDEYHGYAPNSQEGNRAFWEEQSRRSR